MLSRLLSFFYFILASSFRNWIKDDPSAEYPPEANRYHLYVALACPWVNIISLLLFFSSKYLLFLF
jgi:glutathionyl-hydroquinone reductase